MAPWVGRSVAASSKSFAQFTFVRWLFAATPSAGEAGSVPRTTREAGSSTDRAPGSTRRRHRRRPASTAAVAALAGPPIRVAANDDDVPMARRPLALHVDELW